MKKRKFNLRFSVKFIKTNICVILTAILLTACSGQVVPTQNDFTEVPQDMNNSTSNSQTQQEQTGEQAQNLTPQQIKNELPYRAMWISYLDFFAFDTSSEQAFTQSVIQVFDNCLSVGVNTVIVQVRPFSDAIYPSEIYPFSHLITGVQGQSPNYDPLAILVEQAHAKGLLFEAWINPYRVSLNSILPEEEIAQSNPAIINPDWVRKVDTGMFFDPSIPEAQQMIIDGVLEIINNYDVDGIHFDDYFYPTTDASFDEETYALYANGQDLASWRRENVNTLIRNVYSAIKQADPTCVFGISPQGNNDNNYNSQYSDVNLWLAQPGYVDYILPQIYWGFDFTLSNGSQQYAFANCTQQWANYERHESVALAVGIGAYRIGSGDGGVNDQSEWYTGHSIADMISYLGTESGVDGYSIFRYANLFDNTIELQENEKQNIKATLGLS